MTDVIIITAIVKIIFSSYIIVINIMFVVDVISTVAIIVITILIIIKVIIVNIIKESPSASLS